MTCIVCSTPKLGYPLLHDKPIFLHSDIQTYHSIYLWSLDTCNRCRIQILAYACICIRLHLDRGSCIHTGSMYHSTHMSYHVMSYRIISCRTISYIICIWRFCFKTGRLPPNHPFYPPVIKQGVLENGPFISDFPSYKPPFSSGIFQPAIFDDTRGCTF